MNVYSCPSCGARLFPEVLACACGQALMFDPRQDCVTPLDDRACAHRARLGCSWIAEGDGGLCLSCATTQLEPHLSADDAPALWEKAEAAKRWALVGLLRLGWFVGPDAPLPVFHMLSEKVDGARQSVMMGHQDGLITLNIMEADPARAQARKQRFAEPLRTMVGHVRHELAHFLFDRLAQTQPDFAPAFRALMGDERDDYATAMAAYYENGPADGWQDTHISAYATAHPHEDWAETAANALHLLDLSHSAQALNLGLAGDSALDQAQTVGVMLNHFCRSLGQPDPYPMIISPGVHDKLSFALGYLDCRGSAV